MQYALYHTQDTKVRKEVDIHYWLVCRSKQVNQCNAFSLEGRTLACMKKNNIRQMLLMQRRSSVDVTSSWKEGGSALSVDQ